MHTSQILMVKVEVAAAGQAAAGVPKHAKLGIAVFILLSTLLSAYGVWAVSTRGDGTLLEPATWDGADPGFGASTILLVGLIGIWFILRVVRTRPAV